MWEVRYKYFARVTIEFTSPFLVGTGEGDVFTDVLPVVDANGLPVIPGTSIAGVLRNAFSRTNPDIEEQVFGTRMYRGRRADDLHGSALWVSWAHIHDSHGRPVEGVFLEGLPDDPVLAAAVVPTVRDHVRIAHRGVAADKGKFDEATVCAGHRFTFDLMMEGGPDSGQHFDALLGLLASPAVRLGRSTRRGLGRFRVVRILKGVFDVATPEGLARYGALPVRLDEHPKGLEEFHPEPPEALDVKTFELTVEPEGLWGVNGSEAWTLEGEEGKPPDFNPVRDVRVVWNESTGQGSVSDPTMYVPGSAIKGALAHRTAFYANAAQGRFAMGLSEEELEALGRAPEVKSLFGSIKTRRGSEDRGSDGGGRAGRVLVEDVWLEPAHEKSLIRVMHNSLDRFTGGTRGAVLFEERAICKGPPITLRFSVLEPTQVSRAAREAFFQALRDLAEGRLALGGGTGRGNGFFRVVGRGQMDRVRSALGLS